MSESSGPEAGPDRQPAEGGTGTAVEGLSEEAAEQEQENQAEGAAQGGAGRVD